MMYVPGGRVIFVFDPLNRYMLVWAEPASIPNCKTTTMASPRRVQKRRSGFRQKAAFFNVQRFAALCRDAATVDGCRVFIIVPFLHFFVFNGWAGFAHRQPMRNSRDRKRTRLNSSHLGISYA